MLLYEYVIAFVMHIPLYGIPPYPYVDAMSELVTNPYICVFCGWEVMSGSPLGLDPPLTE